MMKRKKNVTSIQTKIFLSYGSIILILIILASNLYYFTAYNAFIKNYTTSSRQLSKIVSGQVDQYLEEINSLQKKILESDLIRDYIFEYAALHDSATDRDFRKMIYMITGYDTVFYHMNILNLENNLLIPFGNRYNPIPLTITDEIQNKVVLPVVTLRGAKCILPTDQGALFIPDPDISTFSFVRSFPRYSYSLSNPKGIIEIQISCTAIEHIIEEMLLSYANKAESVYIFNEQQQLIFPTSLSQKELDFYAEIDTGSYAVFSNPITGKKELITSYISDFTGFTTLIVTPEASLLSNKYFFRNMGMLIAFTSILLLIIITYKLAKSISSPIVSLRDSIMALQLDTISEESAYLPKSGLNELEMLSSAYNHMQLRLKQSLDDIVEERTLSIHSQIMALQAQMDSHFLYNTLTIISIIAEENNDIQASEMCLKLTRMLRYITEDYSRDTTFREELEHAANYTDLMKIRFADKINFQYETDAGMDMLSVPRLIVQPLIENCVKYARDDSRILTVSVRSYIKDDYWYTEITDNGSGFTKETLDTIYERIEKLNSAADYSELSIDGMGMVNIYLRLKLYYNENLVFYIYTSEAGAVVQIGGRIFTAGDEKIERN